MNLTKNKMSVQEAKASLKSHDQFKNQAIKKLAPPIWYTVVSSSLVALFTFSFASMTHENIWALGAMIFAGLIVFLEIFILYSYSLLGIRIKQLPTSRSGIISYVALILLFVVIFALARNKDWFHLPWRAYGFAVLNFILVYYLTIKYPTGEILVN